MLDPANDLLQPPSSPTISSVSSSDLDTESTGSFFHDRSTTLGTLMGVTFPAISFRVPSQHREANAVAARNGGASAGNGAAGGGGGRKSAKVKSKLKGVVVVGAAERRRRRWWKLCRDDVAKPGSLGEFLEVERRFGDGAFYGATAELEGVVTPAGNGRLLFADGRVLPPVQSDGGPSTAASLCRFPVSLTGICSGGVG